MFSQKVSKLTNPFSTPAKPKASGSFVGTGLSLASPKVTKPEYSIINVWAAYSTFESGAINQNLGYFSTSTKANNIAKGQGYWGGPGLVLIKRALVLKEGGKKKYFILEHESPVIDKAATSVLKANALKKLTLEDKRVLGLA